MNKNMSSVGFLMLFFGARMILIGYYPYTLSEVLDSWGWQLFLLLAISVFALSVLVHEVIHFFVAKSYGSKPSFGLIWTWKMPCPCVRFNSSSLSNVKLVVISMAPQLITVCLFMVSLVYSQSLWGYLFFNLGFAHLYGSVYDFTNVLVTQVEKWYAERE